MKKIILITIAILSFSSAFSQKIVKNEIDEFTKNSKKITSWEKLNRSNGLFTYMRIRKIDNKTFLDIKIIMNSPFSIDKGENILLKLSDDSILKLKNSKYEMSSRGEGAIGIVGSDMPGVFLTCDLSEEQIKTLKEKKILKTRVNTTNGYVDGKVKKKHGDSLKELLALI